MQHAAVDERSERIAHRFEPAGCTDPSGAALKTDQRGRPRPDRSETRCDIGAYEYQDKSAK